MQIRREARLNFDLQRRLRRSTGGSHWAIKRAIQGSASGLGWRKSRGAARENSFDARAGLTRMAGIGSTRRMTCHGTIITTTVTTSLVRSVVRE